MKLHTLRVPRVLHIGSSSSGGRLTTLIHRFSVAVLVAVGGVVIVVVGLGVGFARGCGVDWDVG